MDLIPALRPNCSRVFEHGRKYPGRSGAFTRGLFTAHESVLDSIDSPRSEFALVTVPNGRCSGLTTCLSVPPFQQIPGKVEFSSVQRVSQLSAEMVGSAAAMLKVGSSTLFYGSHFSMWRIHVRRTLGLRERAGRCGRGLAFASKPSFCARISIPRLLEIYG